MGLFDIEPYTKPHDQETADPQSYLEHLQRQTDGDPNNNSIVADSGQDEISRLARELNIKLDDTSKDYLYQYYLSNKNSENAFNRELYASSTQYQRVVEDLKKAGLNPFLAFDSLRGSGASSSSGSISGGLLTDKQNSKREQGQKYTQTIVSILGMIAAAAIYALA